MEFIILFGLLFAAIPAMDHMGKVVRGEALTEKQKQDIITYGFNK